MALFTDGRVEGASYSGTSAVAASGLYLAPVPVADSYGMPFAAANAYEHATGFEGEDHYAVPVPVGSPTPTPTPTSTPPVSREMNLE